MQPQGVRQLVQRIKSELGYNVWCYTGYTWEEIVSSPVLLDAVREMDVVVDGPFVQAQRELGLRFRGSANQRMIDVRLSLEKGGAVLWTEN